MFTFMRICASPSSFLSLLVRCFLVLLVASYVAAGCCFSTAIIAVCCSSKAKQSFLNSSSSSHYGPDQRYLQNKLGKSRTSYNFHFHNSLIEKPRFFRLDVFPALKGANEYVRALDLYFTHRFCIFRVRALLNRRMRVKIATTVVV